MTLLNFTGTAVALDLIVFGTVGVYVLIQRMRGKPAPQWLPMLNRIIKPDRKRLDRLIGVLARI